jgi:hypothetical protein
MQLDYFARGTMARDAEWAALGAGEKLRPSRRGS